MRFLKLIAILMVVLSLTLFTACDGAGDAIVAGSTSVQPYAEILSHRFREVTKSDVSRGFVVDVQGGGSGAGIKAAETHTADVGMSSRSLKPEEEEKLDKYIIAKDGLAIIVHKDNTIEGLTLAQLQDIYSGKIQRWNEIDPRYRNKKIHVITREEGSGTRSAFEELVMTRPDKTVIRITSKAMVQNANGMVKMSVGRDIDAIGFVSLGIAKDKVKPLKLNGVEATFNNVKNETYPLFRPFLFVTPKDKPPVAGSVAKQFIDFVLSEDGQRLLMLEGLIPMINLEDDE